MFSLLRRSIALKYIICVVMFLVTLGGVGGYMMFERQKQDEGLRAARTSEIILEDAANALQSWIDGQVRLGQALAENDAIIDACLAPADREKAALAGAVLQKIHNAYGYYENIPLAAKMPAGETFQVQTGKGTRTISDGTFFVDTVSGNTLGKGGSGLSYIQALWGGRSYFVSQVYPSLLRGNPIFVVATPVRSGGEVVGALILAPKMSYFTEAFVSRVKLGDTGFLFFSDARDLLIAHRDSDAILNKQHSAKYAEVLSRISGGEGSFVAKADGEQNVYHARRIDIPSEHILHDWFICSRQSQAEINATAFKMLKLNMLQNGGMLCVIAVVLFFMTTWLVVRPLKKVGAYATAIAGGDFNASPGRMGHDEIGELGRTLHGMTEDIIGELHREKGFMTAVLDGIANPFAVTDTELKITACSRSMVQHAGRSGDPKDFIGMHLSMFLFGDASKPVVLKKVLEERKARTGVNFSYTNLAGKNGEYIIDVQLLYGTNGEIIGGITFWNDVTELRREQAAIAEQNRRIETGAVQADEASGVVREAVDALGSAAELSMNRSEEQKARVSETVTAIEEMNATVLEVARNAGDAAQSADSTLQFAQNGEVIVGESVDAIIAVRESIKALHEDMERLGKRVDGIGNVMNVINDIADQTNLLALNAAIEAARAGDAGRGFAVVADEVRKLAEKTMAATREVGEAVTAIQTETRGSIEAMAQADGDVAQSAELARKARGALEEILTLTRESSDKVRNIATAAEQQSAASEQIARSATEIDSIAGETAKAMEMSAREVAALEREVENIRRIIGGMRS